MGLLGDAIGLTFKISAQTDEGRKEVDKFFSSVKSGSNEIAKDGTFSNLASSIGSAETAVGKLAGAVPIAGMAIAGLASSAVGVVSGLFAMAKNASEYGSAISDASQKTGLAVGTISALKFGADSFGSSFEEVNSSVTKFTKLIGEAASGNEKAQNTLKRLGVEPKAAINDLEGAFEKAVKRIYELPPGVEQSNAAMAAFGKTGANLIPFINSFNGDLSQLTKQAKELGLVLSDEDARIADEFGDQLEITQRQMQGLTFEFSKGFMPAFTGGMNEVSSLLKTGQSDARIWGENTGLMLSGVIAYWRQATTAAREYFGAAKGEKQSWIGQASTSFAGFFNWSKYLKSKGLESKRNAQAEKYNTDLANAENAMPGVGEYVPNDKKQSPKNETPSFFKGAGTGKTGKVAGENSGKAFDKEFKEFAKELDFVVSRTFGKNLQGKKGGSLHPAGLAGDLSIKGKSPEQIFEALAAGIERGWRALDERFIGALPGVNTKGPNAHFEKNPRKPSMFVDNRPDLYGGQENLDFLKELDKKRLNKSTSKDELTEFKKKKADEREKADEKEVTDQENKDKKIIELVKARSNEEKAILDKSLASKLISEEDYTKKVSESEINLLRIEKTLLDERSKMKQLSDDERANIQQQIALISSEITVKETEKGTEAIKRQNESLERQLEIAEEIADLRRQVLENDRQLIDFRKDQQRKTLSNTVDISFGKDKLEALVVLRNFDIEEAKEKKKRDDSDALTAYERDIRHLESRAEKDVELKKRIDEEKFHLEELYKDRLEMSDEEYQAKKKEIEDSYERPTLDAQSGVFGQLSNGIGSYLKNVSLLEDANGKLHFSFAQTFASITDMGIQAFGALAQGFGQMVGNWVLYGNQGEAGMRKMFAGILAQVATTATTYAIMSLGAAALASTAFGAAILGGTPAQFLAAAALFGSIAGVTAVAGRAVAGDSFSQKNVSSQFSNTANSDNTSSSANNDETRKLIEDRNQRMQLADQDRNRNVDALIKALREQKISLEIKSNDSHIIDVVGDNISSFGKLDSIIINRSSG